MNKNNRYLNAKMVAFRVYHLRLGMKPLIDDIENKSLLEIAQEEFSKGLLYFNYNL